MVAKYLAQLHTCRTPTRKLSVVIDKQEEPQVTSAPSPTRPFSARATAALMCTASLGLAAVLSGCGAGQITHTAEKISAIQGINAQAGDIAIRNATVLSSPNAVWEAGSDVPLSVVLVNEGHAADSLIDAESTLADNVELVTGEYQPPVAQPQEHQSPSATVDTSATPTPSTSLSPSTPAPTDPNPTPDTQLQSGKPTVALEPGDVASLTGVKTANTEAKYLVLKDVTSPVKAGEKVKVTFTFESAGETTLELPISPPTQPRERKPLDHGTKEGH